MKTCAACGATKAPSEYHRKQKSRDGLHNYCKECTRAKNKAWVEANRERQALACKNWYEANRDRAVAKRKAWYYQTTYGVAHAEFLAQASAQRDCLICGCKMVVGGRGAKNAVMDHCHATGENRGIICSGCNKAIGLLGDDPDVLRAAAAYIERSRRKAAA